MIGVLLLALLFTGVTTWKQKASPRTRTTLGELIGTTYNTYSGRTVNAFFGVPYAKPPVDELRFEPPQPLDPWPHPKVAKTKANVCTQPNLIFPLLSTGSEDCLYLDVYTPLVPRGGKCKKYMPVMLYIHPGAFLIAGGVKHEPFFIMDKHDLVFVPINYRMGALGYFSTGDLVVPGNNGQKDQVMAMRWIKEHARSFCGDPDQITIAGSSAGSISVGLHMLSPLAKGLFNRVIGASGNPYCSLAYRPLVIDFGRIMAKKMDCPTDDSRAMVNCLKTKNSELFWSYDLLFRPFFFTPLVDFALVLEPCHEGAYLTKLPEVYFEQEEIYDVPVLSLTNEYEGILFIAFYVVPSLSVLLDLTYTKNFRYLYDFNSTTPASELTNVAVSIMKEYYHNGFVTFDEHGFKKSLSDRYFLFPEFNYVRDLARRISSEVYFLESAYRGQDSSSEISSIIPLVRNFGSSHTDSELLVILNGLFQQKHSLNKNDAKMMHFMTDVYYSFMVNGKPFQAEELGWKPVPKIGKYINYLRINGPNDLESRKTDNYGNQKFWSSIPYLPNRGFPYADSCNQTHQIYYHKG